MRSPDTLDFRDDDPRTDHVERFPHPVVHAVQIERKQVHRPLKTIFLDETIHILPRDPRRHEPGRVAKRIPEPRIEVATLLDESLVAVEQQSMPAMVDNKIGRVAFDAVPGADLDAAAPAHSDQSEHEKQDPIFAILTERSEFNVFEGGQRYPAIDHVPVLVQQNQLRNLVGGADRGCGGRASQQAAKLRQLFFLPSDAERDELETRVSSPACALDRPFVNVKSRAGLLSRIRRRSEAPLNGAGSLRPVMTVDTRRLDRRDDSEYGVGIPIGVGRRCVGAEQNEREGDSICSPGAQMRHGDRPSVSGSAFERSLECEEVIPERREYYICWFGLSIVAESPDRVSGVRIGNSGFASAFFVVWKWSIRMAPTMSPMTLVTARQRPRIQSTDSSKGNNLEQFRPGKDDRK